MCVEIVCLLSFLTVSFPQCWMLEHLDVVLNQRYSDFAPSDDGISEVYIASEQCREGDEHIKFPFYGTSDLCVDYQGTIDKF